MTTEELSGLLDRTLRTHDIVDEREVARLLGSPGSAPSASSNGRRLCWLTFDDGYLDNLEHAAPVLQERGLTASIFVTSNTLRGDWLLPVDRWYQVLATATRRTGTLAGADGVGWAFDLDDVATWARLVAGPEKSAFVAAPPREQRQLLEVLSESLASPHLPVEHLARRLYLHAEDLLCLGDLGWSIGGHGRTHRLLPDLDDSTLADEVRGSHDLVSSDARHPSRFFAYPDGACSTSLCRRMPSLFDGSAVVGALGLFEGAEPPSPWRIPRMLPGVSGFAEDARAELPALA